MKKCEKKVAIITGATCGIGLAAARLFLSKGYKVYGIARRPYDGTDFKCFSADVCDYDKIDAILKEVFDTEGRLDVFVNNAGMGIAGAMEDATPQRIENIVNVNLTALCVLSGKAVKYLRHTKGRIINVSSMGGILPLPYQAVYSATKSGAEIFSRALANELKAYGVKVCAVLPNDTNTGFTDARICEGENATAKKSIEKMARDERRGKSPEFVAKAIYKAATKKRPPLRISVGAVSKLETFLSRLFPVKLINFIIRKIYC